MRPFAAAAPAKIGPTMAARASSSTGHPAACGRQSLFAGRRPKPAGAEALAAGKVAALLVAGGQGTRLGFDHPKGLYRIGPVSQASLFQILMEKMLAAGRRYGVSIPLYLMTSPATHAETLEYLAANGRFGLPEQDLHVFCQGTMPAVDAESGRLLLESPGSLALSPDGHGGMLAALARSGGLDDLAARGIEQLFYFQVDNPLAPVCDAAFLGYHLLAGSELSTLVVAKEFPTERVGNVASVDGRLRIIEYSDLPRSGRQSPRCPTARSSCGPATRRSTCSTWPCSPAWPTRPTRCPFIWLARRCRIWTSRAGASSRPSRTRSSSSASSSICCRKPDRRSWSKPTRPRPLPR